MSHDRIAPEVEARYGFRPSVRRLTGENENYLVKRADGARFVLRLIAGKRCRERILLEHAMVEAALEAGIAVALPRLIPDLHGNLMFAVGGKGCEPRLGRLMAYVPGVSWRNEPPDCQELLTSLGGLAARFATALSSVDLPAARRTHRWDLAEAGAHRSDLVIAGGPDQYRLLAAQFERWAAYRREMAEVPWGLIHGDLNDDNVLTADGRISHVLDFSDSLYNPLVCELAIALTYAMFYESEPWGAAAPVVGGYHAYRPLSATEIELLHPLVCGRLAASVVISAKRRQIDPARKGWFVTEDQAWAFLEKHGDHDPVEIADRLSELIDVRPYADRGAPAAVLLDRRRRVLSAAQSISYRRPVKFVRGRGAYLIDGRGRPFLDLHNNVCHVGHCHPRVVRAGQEQMARLSTNTRYLTDAHVSFSQRLAGLFPPYLDTVFLVNSGTEANELALRLASTHTGHEDV
ncbi:MAG: aminotransferase class III-fold pyridoxal phosphate-dependent enzyme, partial [Anaerolineae bacterium]